MAGTRKIAAILVADVVGYSRLAGADEDRTLARLRGLRSDLIDPAIDAHHGRIVKRTGDGSLIEFRSVVDAVRCAIEMQTAWSNEMRACRQSGASNSGSAFTSATWSRRPTAISWAMASISPRGSRGSPRPARSACRRTPIARSKEGLIWRSVDLGQTQLKNIADPIRVYSLQVGVPAQGEAGEPAVPKKRSWPAPLAAAIAALLVLVACGGWWLVKRKSIHGRLDNRASGGRAGRGDAGEAKRLSIVVLPFANLSNDPAQDYFADGVTESLTTDLSRLRGSFRDRAQHRLHFQGQECRRPGNRQGAWRPLRARRLCPTRRGRMRVNVQLIDAETGNHLWADRFDKPIADLFEMQDEIVARLANQLGAELVAAEARRAQASVKPRFYGPLFSGIGRR